MFKDREILKEIRRYLQSPESLIITGMRRTGKTTILNMLYQEIGGENSLLLDLENPANRKYFENDNYEQIKSTLEFLGIDFKKRAYIFIDEIQFLKTLPSIVKYFIDHYKVKFFLTGSASFYLKNLFMESLSGRKYIFELFPLNFREFLQFKNARFKISRNKDKLSMAQHEALLPLFEEYLYYGGFPQVVLSPDIEAKKKSLEDIFTSYYQLEILQVGDFRRNEVIRDLIFLLLARIGSKLDIQKLSNELKVSRPTLNNHLSFLQGTYFFHSIRPYSSGKDSEIRKMPKVYACDTGIVNHFARVSKGVLFENAVYQNLRHQGQVHYYQRKGGGELDFILNQKTGFEVKLTAHPSDINKMKKIASQLNLKQSWLIALNFSDLDHVRYPFQL